MSENLIKALLGMHSGWRYIILILLIAAIVYARQTASGKRPFAGATKKLGMFTMIAIDIQLLLGILLYYNFMQVTTHFNLGTFKHQFSAVHSETSPLIILWGCCWPSSVSMWDMQKQKSRKIP